MPDETEFAMLYAAERKKNVELVHRVRSYQYHSIPLVAVIQRLILGIIEQDIEKMHESIMRLPSMMADITAANLLNVIDPAESPQLYDYDTLHNSDTLRDFTNGGLPDTLVLSAKHTDAIWQDLCDVHSFKSTDSLTQIEVKLIRKAMKSSRSNTL